MIVGKPRQQQLIFEGNSLTNTGATSGGSLVTNGHYIPKSLYDAVRTGRALAYRSYAVNSRTQTLINGDLSTNIYPFVKKNDIIVLWEGTNDIFVNALSGADAYANLVTYRNAVDDLGAILVVGTIIARDWATDDVDLMDRVDAYNALVMANSGSFAAVCPLHQDAAFNAKADASNATYYLADKLHQAVGGQDLVISLMTTTINSVL